MITPASKDKRFWMAAGTIGSVLALAACGHTLDEQTLTFLGLTLSAFMAQSQFGQTRRMTAGVVNDPAKPPA